MLHAETIAKTPTGVKGSNEIILDLSPTEAVVSLKAPVEPTFSKKSLYILRENIRTLLHARREEQKTLAEWCGHDKSWMNKFLNEGRGIRVGDFDRIASFFGIETYQLFQPGISRLTERRIASERRMGNDRRIGHQDRQFVRLQTEHAKLPRLAHVASTSRDAPLPEPIRRIIADYEQRMHAEIDAYYTRQQTPTDRTPSPVGAEDHRRIRRPRAK